MNPFYDDKKKKKVESEEEDTSDVETTDSEKNVKSKRKE